MEHPNIAGWFFRDSPILGILHIIELDDGNIYRKPLYLMVKPWFPVDFPLNQSIDHRYNRLQCYFLSPLAAFGGILGAIPPGRAPKKIGKWWESNGIGGSLISDEPIIYIYMHTNIYNYIYIYIFVFIYIYILNSYIMYIYIYMNIFSKDMEILDVQQLS